MSDLLEFFIIVIIVLLWMSLELLLIFKLYTKCTKRNIINQKNKKSGRPTHETHISISFENSAQEHIYIVIAAFVIMMNLIV